MSGRVTVLRGDAAALPLPDASVDLIVTSPPYFGLRSYTDGGEHYDGQVGSEATPREFLEALRACTREWVRVLKPEGSLFVNLGDKYAGGGGGGTGNSDGETRRGARPARRAGFAPDKSLFGMPWRYALGCIDDLGLILRAEIVWAKPNGLPESVTDRVRRSHEQVFHFTRSPRYFAAVDEVREPHHCPSRKDGGVQKRSRGEAAQLAEGARKWHADEEYRNPLGKLPGSVWEIPSQPLTVPAHLGVDHFAAFPMELPRRIILGWSPAGICTACGQGRRPVTDVEYQTIVPPTPDRRVAALIASGHSGSGRGNASPRGNARRLNTITGYACACPDAAAPARPAVVLDPFGGTGTTALVASVHGRIGITNDRSADYCRLAAWRTADPGERARALGVPKPPPVPDGQGELFGRLEAM